MRGLPVALHRKYAAAPFSLIIIIIIVVVVVGVPLVPVAQAEHGGSCLAPPTQDGRCGPQAAGRRVAPALQSLLGSSPSPPGSNASRCHSR